MQYFEIYIPKNRFEARFNFIHIFINWLVFLEFRTLYALIVYLLYKLLYI